MPGRGITEQELTVRIAGTVVRLSADSFKSLLSSEPVDVVICSRRYLLRASVAGRGLLPRGWQYLAVSRGVVFHTITKTQLSLPATIRGIAAEDIWVSFLGPKKAD